MIIARAASENGGQLSFTEIAVIRIWKAAVSLKSGIMGLVLRRKRLL